MKARRLKLMIRVAREHRVRRAGPGPIIGLELDDHLEGADVVWEPHKHPLAL